MGAGLEQSLDVQLRVVSCQKALGACQLPSGWTAGPSTGVLECVAGAEFRRWVAAWRASEGHRPLSVCWGLGVGARFFCMWQSAELRRGSDAGLALILCQRRARAAREEAAVCLVAAWAGRGHVGSWIAFTEGCKMKGK